MISFRCFFSSRSVYIRGGGSSWLLAGLLSAGLMGEAGALNITATFDSSFSTAANPVAAQAAVQTAITTMNSLYLTSASIPVLFMYNAALGGGGSSNNVVFATSYNTWVSSLQNTLAANPGNAPLSTAVANLPATGSVSQSMKVTGAYWNAIMGQSLFLGFDSAGTFQPGGTGSYAAVVTLSAPSTIGNYYTVTGPGLNSTAVTVAEHELNEVLGGGGAGTSLRSSSTGSPTSYGVLDLYRYSSGNGVDGPGTLGARSWTTSSSELAYLSINGGASAVLDANGHPVQFNQNGGSGADYGDLASTYPNIQNAFVPLTAVPEYTDTSAEATMMESIGYTVAAPEPVTLTLLGLGCGAAFLRRRRS